MELAHQELTSIKNIFSKFIKNDDFNSSEYHVESSYTLDILRILGWDANRWKLNQPDERKTGLRPDIILIGESGGTLFVIESKKPKEKLSGRYEKKTFEQQVCNYIDSEGISWGILTNFKEWAIYNSHSFKLNKTLYKKIQVISDDKKLICTDDELSNFFCVLKNKILNDKKGKVDDALIYYPKQEEIKEEFFKNLKTWRTDLRNYIFKKEKLSLGGELEFQTQKILDRLIFIDFCFDKKIIHQDFLGSSIFSKNHYDSLKDKFKELDELFNSEIFASDKCDKFNIPNEVIAPIIKGIKSVDFSKMNAHIMGEVYERYLGEILKEGKEKVNTGTEDKAHLKRKSLGIYYTPDYIVEHIIKNTIDEKIKKCKNQKELEKIKILDPACGSGSFLIQAFDILYNAYMRFQTQLKIDTEIEISKKILLHNIYGVDLDERAVDIAKLNLLLRAIEKMSKGQIIKGRKLLPNLSLNIRSGNSLVSGKNDESLESSQLSLSFIFEKKSVYKDNIDTLIELKNNFYTEENSEEKEKIIEDILLQESKINKYLNQPLENIFKHTENLKPFNYEVAFCEVMKKGGFDCIIGNPPYGSEIPETQLTLLKKEHKDIIVRTSDSFMFFINKSYFLLRAEGLFGMIIPDVLLYQTDNEKLRKKIIDNCSINLIANVGNVFDGVNRPTCILVFKKIDFKNCNNFNYKITGQDVSNNKIEEKRKLLISGKKVISYDKKLICSLPNSLFITKDINKYDILAKFYSTAHHKLKDVTDSDGIQRGVSPDLMDAFVVTAKQIDDNNLEANKIKKTITGGKHIKKYHINYPDLRVIYTTKEDDFSLIPNICKYIDSFKNYITCKEVKNKKHPIYALHRPRKESIFLKSKIVGVITEDELVLSIDNKNTYCLDGVYLFGVNAGFDFRYILGVLNSAPFTFIYRLISLEEGRGLAQVKPAIIEHLPIRKVTASNKKTHDKIVRLAGEMLVLNKNPEKNKVEILVIDSEINDEVYKLYNISKSDKKVIEESLKKKSKNDI